MEKLKMQSHDVIGSNTQKIAQLFPNCVTERLGKDGKPELAIDFEKLQAELSNELIGEGEERYQFTWPDKRAAVRLANTPTNMTLRPCREESVDFDNTQNLYIEGDNLDVLKVLRETYLGKVKMIYIDPPYNTGNDFVYNDDFSMSIDEYETSIGLFDDEGNKLFKNTESNGRFHTDWLNMIYPRLKAARDLLSEDGVIFISIDDNEVENLRKVCDEVFGESNFIAQCVRKRRDSQANLSKNISPIHEYVVIYAKHYGDILNKVSANIDESAYKNPDNDPRGAYVTMPCTNKGGAIYTVRTPTGAEITEEWRFKKETYNALLADNRLVFPRGGEGKPRYKLFLSEKKAEGQLANTWLETLASNQEATREIKEIFNDRLLFDTPKPVGLLVFCIQLATQKDSIILDFFSGSATTAHAVMKLNAEDGGNRKFIMVQLPEKTDEKSEAYKAGYKNICEIGKERIRRAGAQIVGTQHGASAGNTNNDLFNNADAARNVPIVDVGFRVLKLDSSNMEDVYYTPGEFSMTSLFNENVKADRSNEDLLFQVMLDLGIELSVGIKNEKLEVKDGREITVHNVDEGYLMACFDRDIDETAITEIAKRKPVYFVMRDASAASDNVIDNFEQIFRHYSPDTNCRII